jgi:hypothetical protein
MPASERHGSTRTTPAALLILAAALLVARVAFGVIDATHPELRPELVQWTSPSEAAAAARSTGRLILYAFTDGGAASRRLAGDLFTNPDVAKQLEGRFIAVRVDGGPAHDTPDEAALRAKFGVGAEPALVVTNADGSKFQLVPTPANAPAALQALSAAQMEVMDLPFRPAGRSFRFQIGNRHGAPPDSLLPPVTGEADSTQ